ncbi:(4Fe-4S)-binding protein [candidate division WOR-3 bacterium JGI_Cruoil_03_44_89]|uniref:(4Fe-4S)-binding protein n=1 Tax=candidate division WOR-3 bacterium JGI_Cruoil_03_44_89 TaxID=1973748 RepID=A0A235BS14_UNCW3|nr:MAG: (4Fe-4S)-binding protein [candidate division WOR-3 bacterium JGI_Cruoil_03_44_89]
MIVSIASGKGGTGKTTVATSLALYLNGKGQNTVILDCDVEEPDSALFLKPVLNKPKTVDIPVPTVDFERCTYCGRCAEVCAYNAIAVAKKTVLVFPELCHGCGGCALFCPEGAISEVGRDIGVVEEGDASGIKFVQGQLKVGEPMAVPLIREVKRRGIKENKEIVIIDVPPGTSCPVIKSVEGSDFVILVTEPTPFGLNDLKLAVETVKKISIPFGVVINKDGIGDSGVDLYCELERIPILTRFPFSREIAVAYSKGIPIIDAGVEFRQKFEELYDTILSIIQGGL